MFGPIPVADHQIEDGPIKGRDVTGLSAADPVPVGYHLGVLPLSARIPYVVPDHAPSPDEAG